MNIHEATAAARKYLFETEYLDGPTKKGELKDWRLDRSLQYLLCGAFKRLEAKWGSHNVTDKDIHLLVESWIMAEGTKVGHREPLVREGTPENINE